MKDVVLAVLAAAVALPAYADEAHHKPAAGATAQLAAELSEGEVRRVDRDAKNHLAPWSARQSRDAGDDHGIPGQRPGNARSGEGR